MILCYKRKYRFRKAIEMARYRKMCRVFAETYNERERKIAYKHNNGCAFNYNMGLARLAVRDHLLSINTGDIYNIKFRKQRYRGITFVNGHTKERSYVPYYTSSAGYKSCKICMKKQIRKNNGK